MGQYSKRLAAAFWIVLPVASFFGASRLAGKTEGLVFTHSKHAELEMECKMCHVYSDEGEPTRPNEELCANCHEIDRAAPGPDCRMCHSNDDYTITRTVFETYEDVIFKHEPHAEGEIHCTECHGDVAKKSDQSRWHLPRMSECVDCHEKSPTASGECKTCHKVLDKSVMPERHGKRNVSHRPQSFWEKRHGQEYGFDEAYCQICHDRESWCLDCHQDTKPRDHSVSWKRKPHGLKAQWDRKRCIVCHEEDSCVKCHSNTKPTTHRGMWSRRRQTHCINCHPRGASGACRACHEEVDHRTALFSPHPQFYPTPCAVCHPLGRPGKAPHLTNPMVSCRTCH